MTLHFWVILAPDSLSFSQMMTTASMLRYLNVRVDRPSCPRPPPLAGTRRSPPRGWSPCPCSLLLMEKPDGGTPLPHMPPRRPLRADAQPPRAREALQALPPPLSDPTAFSRAPLWCPHSATHCCRPPERLCLEHVALDVPTSHFFWLNAAFWIRSPWAS